MRVAAEKLRGYDRLSDTCADRGKAYLRIGRVSGRRKGVEEGWKSGIKSGIIRSELAEVETATSEIIKEYGY